MKTTRAIEPRSGDRPVTLLRASGDTHPGLQRQHNEDRFHYDAGRGIFLVVDGVGGHAAGEKAAETAVAVIRDRLERETGTVQDRIREAITLANNNIHRLASWQAEWRGMGCVLTVAVVTNGSVVVGHVGDTRLYKLRGGRLEKITRDHSPVGEREDAQELSEAEAMRHPRRNEVYRDVGSEPHEPGDPAFVDIFSVPFEPDAALLLCSDGLSDVVSSATVGDLVRTYAGHPYEVVRSLIDAANEGGGKDNVTVVYVEGPEFSRAQLALPPPERARPQRAPVSSPSAQPGNRLRVWRLSALLALLIVVTGATAILLVDEWRNRALSVFPLPSSATETSVDPTQSIAAAITRAASGSTIVVEPGEYREQLRLKRGVRVQSRIPGGAALRLPGGASEADPAVVAVDVTGAEFSGFRIVGDAATPLGAGIFVRDAEVVLSDIEVTGAKLAAIEYSGTKGGSLLGAYIHDNPGVGLVVRSGTAPRIAHSHFAHNGGSQRAPAAIVIEPGAQPELSRNMFFGINPDVWTAFSPDARELIRQSNWFGQSDGGRDSRGGSRTAPAPSDRRAPRSQR